MFKRLLSSAIIFGAAALAPPALAQTARCMPRDHLIGVLSDTYSETLHGGGLQNTERLIEVWNSEETGSFTVFLTRPDGVSCVIASGQNWNVMKPAPPGVSG